MKNIDKLLNYLIVFVVVAIGGSFFYINAPSKSKSNSVIKTSDIELDKKVNKYIQQTNRQKEQAQLKIDIALAEAKRKVLADLEAEKIKAENEMSQKPLEQQIWKQEKSKQYTKEIPAENKKDTVKNEEWNVKKMTAQEKKEYAKQYIENARKGGFQIELNDDLEVIRATPIRKPSQTSDVIETDEED